MQFTRHDDGRVTVDKFDDEITATIELPVAPNVIREALGFAPCPDHTS